MTHCGEPMVVAWQNGKPIWQCSKCGTWTEAH